MAYISETDLYNWLDEADITTLKRTGEAGGDKIEISITKAEQYFNDRLDWRYDIDAELSKTSGKNETIKGILSNLALWTLCRAFPFVTLESKVYEGYQQALNDIKEIEKGSLLANYLTENESTTDKKGGIRYGTNDTTENQY